MRVPYGNKHARHLVIAEAGEPPKMQHARERSARLADEAAAGSWNQPPLDMTYQDNVLVSDMTQSGILSRIWESLRLEERLDISR